MITTESPTRVDLAGGTLDCWPLHLFVGDCMTVNLAIDIFTGCTLSELDDQAVEIEIRDLSYRRRFSNLNEMLGCADRELLLLSHVVGYFAPDFGFKLTTYSQSPVGGGLGGSSSLCISLIRAFCKRMNLSMRTEELVELAHNLEAKVIHAPTGTQDYVPAILGGLNILHYTAKGLQVESLEIPLDTLEKNMLLVYTGKSHHSGINNWQVIKSVIEGNQATLESLKEISRISSATADACRKQLWSDLPELFRCEFDSRIKLTSLFSSPEIEKLKKLAIAEGAQAVKICGAGGGGCVLIWASHELHERIGERCLKSGFHPLKAKPARRLLAP